MTAQNTKANKIDMCEKLEKKYYHIQHNKNTVGLRIKKFIPSFENSVDPDQLASNEAS